ncbi:hypothetical protein [Amycolatopsis taiwanensis]|uniref:DUF3558 domain-containing protein n=1 Tax=Amycolatopsis taiwanensis TaxID=342230 RepID=A0A9W6QXC2_9PSEU|nr:hypothetical protein [Amycolatopsis taiwanensis]GLY65279.1 hypothetical protein Atai01_18980 [Amycolatopsis taiwanensis]
MARYLGAFALCAVALVLAGCTTTIMGSASPNQAVARQIQEERTPLTASAVFGDLTTIDYCSMFDAQAAKDAGVTDVSEPVSSYDDCYVEGKLRGLKIDVELGFLDKDQQANRMKDPVKTLPHGLVAKRDLTSRYGSCGNYLSFSDGVDLDIYSYLEDGQEGSSAAETGISQSLCSLDSALLDGVVTAVTQKKVAHLTFAPGSLGTVDPCTLIPDSLVREQAAVLHERTGVALPREANPSKHRCRWANTDRALRAALWFYIDKAPAATPPATTETIGNRSSIVNASPPDYCQIDTVLGPAPGAKNGAVSVAQIYVSLGGLEDACPVARAMANQAWPQLPLN